MSYLDILPEFLLIDVHLSKLFSGLPLIFCLCLPVLAKIFELNYGYLLNFLNLSILEIKIYWVFGKIPK